MLDESIQDALNDQINAEYYSSYLYLSMAARFEADGLPGAGAWMRAQADEERAHAMRIFDYVIDRDGQVRLDAIDRPESEWTDPLAAFEDAYEHEVYISGRIDDLVIMADEADDHATYNMLQWFVAEQVEEEAMVQEIIDQLRLVGDDGPGLLQVDRELGERSAGGAPADSPPA